jgi:anti-sigma factor RsiW
MTADRCNEMRLLLQADFDKELNAADAALVATHLAECPECAGTHQELGAFSARLRAELPYHAAPVRLRQMIEARVTSQSDARPRPSAHARRFDWFYRAMAFGAGAAMAACLALLLVLPGGNNIADNVVASHIRALQPGHLTDVMSTDQHTVKPWFDGRLDFAPPVKDLSAQGFPLVGGRLDYLAGRPVAALAYRRTQHVINMYVWPDTGHLDTEGDGERNGYNFVHWSQDGMVFWVVSDLNRTDLNTFSRQWRAAK